jgi:hypothetical protein
MFDEPLIALALKRNNMQLVNLLLQHGANIHAPKEDKPSVLEIFVHRKDWNVVRWLLEHAGADMSREVEPARILGAASAAGQFDIVNLLLEQGVKVHGDVYYRRAVDFVMVAPSPAPTLLRLLQSGADIARLFTSVLPQAPGIVTLLAAGLLGAMGSSGSKGYLFTMADEQFRHSVGEGTHMLHHTGHRRVIDEDDWDYEAQREMMHECLFDDSRSDSVDDFGLNIYAENYVDLCGCEDSESVRSFEGSPTIQKDSAVHSDEEETNAPPAAKRARVDGV